MFTSVHIQNFRQFRDLELKNLARINLITGQNNTGKTSLLEALFLLDGPVDPYRTTVLARFRGIDSISSVTPEHWDWLFHQSDTTLVIWLRGEQTDGDDIVLNITQSRGSVIPSVDNGKAVGQGRVAPSVSASEPFPSLLYDWSHRRANEVTEYRWTGQGLVLNPDRRRPGEQGFFLPDYHRVAPADIVRVSRLEASGKASAVVDALRAVEPRLAALRVLDLGDGVRIYADLGVRPFVPVSMMGAGIARVLTLLSAIVLREAPVLLVDEIGTGLHHGALVNVWRAIIATALEYDVQVFATTHSLEAIQAAVEGSEGHEGSLAFYRLERRGDDIRVVAGEDHRLRAAVSVGAELR